VARWAQGLGESRAAASGPANARLPAQVQEGLVVFRATTWLERAATTGPLASTAGEGRPDLKRNGEAGKQAHSPGGVRGGVHHREDLRAKALGG